MAVCNSISPRDRSQKTILLIVCGGIAAYKVLELVRLLRAQHIRIIPVMTRSAKQFITPLSLATLAGEKLHDDLFDLTDEVEIGHIELTRMADLVMVIPATANIIAKMAHGLCDDLASTLLMANLNPVLICPAMNHAMWNNPATQQNCDLLTKRGAIFVDPEIGAMACNETGIGRLASFEIIINAVMAQLKDDETPQPLAGKNILVTAGPTHEPIDDVRYIANHSSGKQGYAIAGALAKAGARVTLISGPTSLACPAGIIRKSVMTAVEMYDATLAALPCDVAIMCAAVGDWRPAQTQQGKIKKQAGQPPAPLALTENPDILKTIANHPDHRPALVIGFAAEADKTQKGGLALATQKYQAKGCDWILFNDVGADPSIFGGDDNEIHFITKTGVTAWQRTSKVNIAQKLTDAIIENFNR
ncbi:MAG: bifunctional phosphopantothenoylcysteine decarboxylase/phosphopantothenate--cysteine ligase CoaBC [Alphaproteobacteria bacterium]